MKIILTSRAWAGYWEIDKSLYPELRNEVSCYGTISKSRGEKAAARIPGGVSALLFSGRRSAANAFGLIPRV